MGLRLDRIRVERRAGHVGARRVDLRVVLEGRAVQDVWIVPSRGRRHAAGSSEGEYGTTSRFYDPLLDAWLVTWSGLISRARRALVARRWGDAIVQEGQTEEGYPLRWIFSEIAEKLVPVSERLLERRREDVAPAYESSSCGGGAFIAV
jgi:hypothetical protein